MLDGPFAKRIRKDEEENESNKKQLIVILEKCSLESAKVGKDYVILTSDKHANFIRSQKKDPNNFRPDILHQCLLMLLDSPLNRAGLLRVYVHTANNVLIEINPQTRLPRTFDRFCGLMVQLLHKLSIRAANDSLQLLKVIKNPVSSYLPVDCRKIVFTYNTTNYSTCKQIAESVGDKPVVIIIGSIASGKVVVDYANEEAKISNFPLSAALACCRLTSSFEDAWNVETFVQ
ncbi:unnamed protein product [Thelazia callipaeda]|uniref:18S rRNA (pseudouridine-N1)-methyltransferase n=1 Tax=Thelazia callipaeda TaxID=103827 RepID=A0A0N5D463_THECL|nr:unnamed protein product [Thelazia callipaeda]